jgi:hypothetical protein
LAGYFTSPQPWNVGWGLILRTHNMPPVLGTYPSLHNSLKYYPNSSNFQQQTNPEWERKITCNLILLLSTHLSTNLVWIIFCSVYGILAILVLKFLFKIILFQLSYFFLKKSSINLLYMDWYVKLTSLEFIWKYIYCILLNFDIFYIFKLFWCTDLKNNF